MRSLFTPSLSALALLLTTALPVAADPVNSFFDVYFDVSDVDLRPRTRTTPTRGSGCCSIPRPWGPTTSSMTRRMGKRGSTVTPSSSMRPSPPAVVAAG